MYPILFDFGEFTLFGQTFHPMIGGYGFFYALGIVVGWLWFRGLGRQLTKDAPWTDIYFLTIIAGIVGAKLLNGITRLDALFAGQISLMDVVKGGGVWLGGALAGFAFATLMFRKYVIPAGLGTNVLFVAIPFGHAVGRLGCLLGGCCYGKPTDLPWGITFHNELAHHMMRTPLGIPLHPTQIYEFLVEMANWALLYFMWRRKAKPWSLVFMWFALYGGQRIFIEALRGDKIRGHVGLLSTSQWISIGMVGFAIAGIFLLLKGRILDKGASWDAAMKAAEAKSSR